jgi:hypothetical protein
MGTLKQPLPQGPNVHCGKPEEHDVHPNVTDGRLNAYCDGVPQLDAFLELVVRVPIAPFGFPKDMPHEDLVQEIRDEGIGTFVIDQIDDDLSRVALRVRWGGQDRVYPLRRGML